VTLNLLYKNKSYDEIYFVHVYVIKHIKIKAVYEDNERLCGNELSAITILLYPFGSHVKRRYAYDEEIINIMNYKYVNICSEIDDDQIKEYIIGIPMEYIKKWIYALDN